jgi:hypothetical protein
MHLLLVTDAAALKTAFCQPAAAQTVNPPYSFPKEIMYTSSSARYTTTRRSGAKTPTNSGLSGG